MGTLHTEVRVISFKVTAERSRVWLPMTTDVTRCCVARAAYRSRVGAAALGSIKEGSELSMPNVPTSIYKLLTLYLFALKIHANWCTCRENVQGGARATHLNPGKTLSHFTASTEATPAPKRKHSSKR